MSVSMTEFARRWQMDNLFYGLGTGQYADIKSQDGALHWFARVPLFEVKRLAQKFGYSVSFAVDRYRWWMAV